MRSNQSYVYRYYIRPSHFSKSINLARTRTVTIPSELISSIPRSVELVEAQRTWRDGELTVDQLALLQEKDSQNVLFELERTGSIQLTDGELTKPSFFNYPRTVPKLIDAPFRYSTEVYETSIKTSRHSSIGLTTEKDVRQCLEADADKVQLDFAKIELTLKMKQNANLLKEFIEINNRLLNRFSREEQKKIEVHVCFDNKSDNVQSSGIDYSEVLEQIQPHQRVFIGVTDSTNEHVETAEEIRDLIPKAAKYIPIDQLGTTDDCGFAPYNDSEPISREKCYDKIRARIQGTKLAEEILNQPL
ncbi:unnamed protein product [Adineta ricciae]|uniref:Cobalamin-independent methionine synthase MetE C-terminal/archaeal domain-containing protein n=1 Tax=Adineta ricciae TaxID=249248 RepID=A0A815VAY2_ADIRI|nr:unnamed protein product [Adineta ricciae]